MTRRERFKPEWGVDFDFVAMALGTALLAMTLWLAGREQREAPR